MIKNYFLIVINKKSFSDYNLTRGEKANLETFHENELIQLFLEIHLLHQK